MTTTTTTLRQRILDTLQRLGPHSDAVLAQLLGVSEGAATSEITQLMGDGLIVMHAMEKATGPGNYGRIVRVK